MPDRPQVAAIVPTMDRPERLDAALESIFDQTYERIEAVVVDASTDDRTEAVVSQYADVYGSDRLTYVSNDSPQGLPAARNQAASATDADLLAFLDDDDRWKPRKIERQVRQFETRPDLGLSYTGRVSVTDDGEVVHTARPSLAGDIFRDLLVRNHLGSPSRVVVPASVFEGVGGFDESLRYQEDWDLYLRIAREHAVGCVPDPLVVRSVHDGGMSRNADQQKQYRELVLDRYESTLREHAVFSDAWATHHTDTAVAYLHNGDTVAGRRELRAALGYQVSPKRLLLYLVALFGHRGFELLVGLKRRLGR
ncbi:glycosyltransferase [Halapricum sp. CBA1109]|uniref:glycosyltransferase family 2 protein n=1 Tax=Halapricum sp. CBA1109 TaxID=2668068 RepID=UPI0012F77CE9|nr:glycosyltransferase family A protein [Halapricum sp. CBA1109]MUV88836.1 glycosyltransferase [Halapricum sp. CBA1109]